MCALTNIRNVIERNNKVIKCQNSNEWMNVLDLKYILNLELEVA